MIMSFQITNCPPVFFLLFQQVCVLAVVSGLKIFIMFSNLQVNISLLSLLSFVIVNNIMIWERNLESCWWNHRKHHNQYLDMILQMKVKDLYLGKRCLSHITLHQMLSPSRSICIHWMWTWVLRIISWRLLVHFYYVSYNTSIFRLTPRCSIS